MPDDSLPQQESHQHGQTAKAKREPKHADLATFLYRPFPFIESLVRQAHEHRSKYKTHRDYTNAMRKVFTFISANVAWFWRQLFNRRTVNPWIGLFTFVLTIATIAQGWFMYYQNTQIEQQIGQTDETIKQMRLEQRAWIAAKNATMYNIVSGEDLTGSITLHNSGLTPGVIQLWKFYFFITDADQLLEREIDSLESQVPRDGAPFIDLAVPPSISMEMGVNTKPGLNAEGVKAVFDGKLRVYLLGRIVYEDAIRQRRVTEFCYSLRPTGPAKEWKLSITPKFHRMD